ncbi:MAG: protease Lon-related BREX system protein BrxL [Firmicutes bacterium]|nr:protease Lon-related BREX system protein BrxL [Bacillota bacterium]
MKKTEFDQLDRIAAKAFDGYIVRKDLVRLFKGQYAVPTYVGEFLLGRYCATTAEHEIEEGLALVEHQLKEHVVRSGEEELFKSWARERGSVRVIDIVSARLDTASDSYLASLPSLRLTQVRISSELVKAHERLLTGGFYAEITLEYDPAIATEKRGRPFGITTLRPIQLSKRQVLQELAQGRKFFTTAQWKHFLLRSIGLEPNNLSPRNQDIILLRMVPFVERNYNLAELGPRGTGKSHLFQQVSPYSHLVSGGKATVARMFVNNATGQRGLVCQYDVVCFDEVSGISFDQKDGVNILKGYMESGEFSRGRESIRAEGSIVIVGNFDVDVEHQQRIGHLFGPLPPEMRNDTAFMDRIHAYVPGWDVPKMKRSLFTDHFGLVSDFLSECWTQLRQLSQVAEIREHVHLGPALSGRDTNAAIKTASGLLKLLYPSPDLEIATEDIEWAVRLALECRRRVKEQQKRIGSAEFRNTMFSYKMGPDAIEQFVATPELHSENIIGPDPLPPGQVWAISPGSQDEHSGLYRVEVTATPGSGYRLANVQAPGPLRESLTAAYQNLLSHNQRLVGDRDARQRELTVQVRALDAAKSGSLLGLPLLLALCGAILAKSLKGGLVVCGGLTIGGSLEPITNAIDIAELAAEKGAATLLAPVSSRRQMNDISDDLAARLTIQYYTDPHDALVKALAD